MDFQTPARSAAGILVVNGDQSFPPSSGQRRGRLVNTVRIVTERLMKNGALADRTVDQDGIRGAIAWEDIGLNRDE